MQYRGDPCINIFKKVGIIPGYSASMTHRSPHIVFGLLAVGILLLFAVNLLWGTVAIPLHEVAGILFQPYCGTTSIHRDIILFSRLPQALTAVVAGAGLAVAGLQMQTVFHNPLAGPSVLGITSGASLGVALVVLLASELGNEALSSMGLLGNVALSTAAIIGAMATLLLMALLARHVEGSVTLLIIGVMLGYVANAAIGVLKFFANDDDVREYVVWGLGSFSRVSGNEVTLFVLLMAVLLPTTLFLVKPMDLLLLGDSYARNLGLNIRKARAIVILCSGTIVAIVTAYCGPIMFIGLAVPHLCRGLLQTGSHRVLVPACILVGALLALFCNLVARMPGYEGVLPVNSVTALVGAPVVVSVLLKRKKR